MQGLHCGPTRLRFRFQGWCLKLSEVEFAFPQPIVFAEKVRIPNLKNKYWWEPHFFCRPRQERLLLLDDNILLSGQEFKMVDVPDANRVSSEVKGSCQQ